ncbi:TPA: L(+)-tartrate dehydratase subunit alpha [Klebsiella pneumoniae]|nr:L(+)-tartrate dehydratase subunit alpha [Klebsiella pneumoniae]
MSKSEQISRMTDIMARFVGYTGKVLPDDVTAKLQDLHKKETSQLADVIFTTMIENQRLAKELDRPSCQDTGVIQFLVECGANFPLIGELEALLRESVIKATIDSPLRHNSVETFDEYNTGKNVGKGTPTVFWEIVPNSDQCSIYTYMAGGGCSLPGKAMVLMPGAGYEGVTRFVLDVMTSYGLNACPPLLVGLGPQGMSGNTSVMGVNIENTARHPSTIGVAVNVGCWSHRKGHIVFDKDLNYTITSHTGVAF